MSNQPIVYPPLTSDLEGGLSWRSLKYFGAGAIMASVTIGSGETLFASRAGAVFGYSLLWCFVAGALMKGVQVYSATRYMVLTGEHPMTHWAHMPGPRAWVPLLIGVLSLFCFPFWQSGLPLMMGSILNWVFGISGSNEELWLFQRGWATLSIVVCVSLVLMESYGFLERAQVLIVGTLLACLFAATIAARPDWYAALVGAFVPRAPVYPDWVHEKYTDLAQHSPWVEMMTCLGAVGGGTYDYVGYVGFLREKKWGAIGLQHPANEIDTAVPASPIAFDTARQNLTRAKRWLLPVQIDTGVGFLCVIVFTICFVMLGAKILNPEHLAPDGRELFSHQARFLTELHPGLLIVYQLGIFMAFFGTIYGAYEIYARTAHECLLPVSRRIREMPFRSFRRIIVLYCGVFGLLFVWGLPALMAAANLQFGPDDIVRPAALVGGVFTCGLWCLAMLWTDRRFLPAPLRMPPLLWVATAISGVVLTLLGVKGIWDYAAGLIGG